MDDGLSAVRFEPRNSNSAPMRTERLAVDGAGDEYGSLQGGAGGGGRAAGAAGARGDAAAAAGLGSSSPSGGVGAANARRSRAAEPSLGAAGRRRATGKEPPTLQLRCLNVFDILHQSRMTVGMIANAWGWTNFTTQLFRQVTPGLCRVHVGKDSYVLPGFLLQDVGNFTFGQPPASASVQGRRVVAGGGAVTDPAVQDVYTRHSSLYFPHMILLLKLRWFLRLHSACCELDYKMCSLKNLILGLQYVVLQQWSEAQADSVFDSKVMRHIGAHLNLESVVDDIIDQLQRALGKSWRGFLEFVATCDPSRCLYTSQMDLSPPQVVPNDFLAGVIDTTFVAYFLRTRRQASTSLLRELYEDLELLGIPVPELPPLRGAVNLRAWAIAKTRPTRRDREKALRREHEKLAQLDMVLLTAAIELHLPEVMASPEELAEASVVPAGQLAHDNFPALSEADLGSGEKPGSAGPPAARVILEERPRLALQLFDAAVHAIAHHETFPQGLRERLFGILAEEYGLTQEQTERLGSATVQNIDGKRLTDDFLLHLCEKEKTRLKEYQAYTNKDTTHLLDAPLVSAPQHKGKPALYTLDPPAPPPRLPFSSAFSSTDMTRSLPELRSFSVRSSDGRAPFKVPLGTGPLTMDPDTRKLRTNGFFIKIPPLK